MITLPSSDIGYGTSIASLNSIWTFIKCSKVQIGNQSSAYFSLVAFGFYSLNGGNMSVKSIVSVLIIGLKAYEGKILPF